MKKLMAAAAGAAVLCASAAAQADEMSWDNAGGLYLRLDTGWSFSREIDNEFDADAGDSYIVGGGVGWRFNDYLRADVTVGYRGGYDAEVSDTVAGSALEIDSDISSLSGMVNAYVDVAKFGMVTPYVGGGIGVSHNRVTDLSATYGGVTATVDDEGNTSFAWQASAGLGIEVSPDITLDVGYRYMDLGTAKTGDTVTVGGASVSGASSEGDLTAHEIQVGIRYSF